MSNKIYICAAIILVMCLAGLVIYSNFEIYPKQKIVYPSRKANNNNYLAAERWLETTGHNVRISNNFSLVNITEADDKVIIIDYWKYDTEETIEIIEWIKQGHYLVVFEDITDLDSELIEIFNEYGSIIKDEANGIKFADVLIENGIITLINSSRFMYNNGLLNEDNARLTWKLTGARTDASSMDILFIRQPDWKMSKSIFGVIMERGNFIPVIVSALLLIFIGFWALIPGFGLVIKEKQRNSRPIKDRFTAEIRFLKKYKALDYYLDKKEKNEYSYKELINQYWRKFNGNAEN